MCQNFIAGSESTYNEMQRKHILVPTIYEYQSSTSSTQTVSLMIGIKHQPDKIPVHL